MHEAVTNSSTTTIAQSPNNIDDSLTHPNFTNRTQPSDQITWAHDIDSDLQLENWHLAQPEDSPPSAIPSSVRPPSSGLKNRSFSQKMTPNFDSNPSNADVESRWRLNNSGQLVDSKATSGWDLADEIVRLNIGDNAQDEHASIRTPPNSKISVAAATHFTEASPLETASIPSVDSSPQTSDHQINISHSRGSSTDTSVSSARDSALSAASNALAAQPSLKSVHVSELKERPHSFSGGLSTADLRRLQTAGDASNSDIADSHLPQQQWASSPFREAVPPLEKPFQEQLSYPTLTSVQRNTPQSTAYDYRLGGTTMSPSNPDDLQVDYTIQQRNFNAIVPQGLSTNAQPSVPQFVTPRVNNGLNAMAYRQPRYPQQSGLGSPTAIGFPSHTSHLSLGSSQQLYDMMLPTGPDNFNPVVSRVQQQNTGFRGSHHHSASDPSALRDATLALLQQHGSQVFPAPAFPPPMAAAPPPLYPGQFYPQDVYVRPDATAVTPSMRIPAQYTGPYNIVPTAAPMDNPMPSTSPISTQSGPSANNRKLGLYKTELCRSWEEKGSCRYGAKCQFAHGEEELRTVARHPKYKTEICRTFWVSGSCPYGKRCCFIHTELPNASPNANAPATNSTETTPAPRTDGRSRSMSTNSDPNDASASLLARITAKRAQESTSTNTSSTPTDASSATSIKFGRPPTGSLRVDTALDGPLKQNKSAYPTFTGNGVLLPAPEPITARSPGPVTAGPDLGRHNASRLEIVGYNQRAGNKTTTPPSHSNPRHSFNGTEDIAFSPSPPVSGQSYGVSPGDPLANQSRTNGHVRAGSAGNWASGFGRGNFGASQFPHAASQNDMVSTPWSSTELAVGSSRLNF